MVENAVIRARINEKTKESASIVLAAMGLTISDAFRMMMTRIAVEKTLPFNPLIPNEDTVAAMEAARRGEVEGAANRNDLFERLNAQD